MASRNRTPPRDLQRGHVCDCHSLVHDSVRAGYTNALDRRQSASVHVVRDRFLQEIVNVDHGLLPADQRLEECAGHAKEVDWNVVDHSPGHTKHQTKIHVASDGIVNLHSTTVCQDVR